MRGATHVFELPGEPRFFDDGQTIFHCDVHLIHRRTGDIESSRGGVRHTIPGEGHY